MDPLEEFDHLVIFNCNNTDFKLICPVKRTLYMDWLDKVVSPVVDVMGERVTSVKCLNIPLRSKITFLAIGLRLNPSMLYTPITRGPRSGTDAGNQFRQFWGDKSEIRHLDGDLFECVIWDPLKDITSQIIDYVLLRNFKLVSGTEFKLWHHVSPTRLSDLLRSFSPPHTSLRLPSRASTLHLIRSLDRLRSVLCSFNKHLPLNIMNVQAISAEFRDTSVFAPIVTPRSSPRKPKTLQNPWHDVHYTLRPIYAIMSIESSNKWPRDNYQAFLHMKRLFLLRIKNLLVHLGIPSRIVSTGMLDIFMNGVIFRVNFCQPVEFTLLRRRFGGNKSKDRKLYSKTVKSHPIDEPEVLRKWLTFNERLPAVASQLVAISRSHLYTFPKACRLAKRWLSAHGFPVVHCPDPCTEPHGLPPHLDQLGDADLGATHCRLSEIAVELLIIRAGGFTPNVQVPTEDSFVSASPLATFLRFLRLLYSFDWAKNILLVDLNDGFSTKEGQMQASSLVAAFKITPREKLPAMVIATPLDHSGTHWTIHGPSVEGLKRLQALAMHSHELLRAMLIAGAEYSDLKAVFRPDLSKMDVLIKLRPSVYKTRILEAVDLEVPSWALKKTWESERPTKSDKTQTTTIESDLVTLELPHPGASYWPKGYLCDPVIWLLRQIQMKFKKWDLFDYLWDRHSGRWLGMTIKDNATYASLIELKSFTESNLYNASGFACHRETPSGSMAIAVDVRSALEALRFWAAEMVSSVEVQRPNLFHLPGMEEETPDMTVVHLSASGRMKRHGKRGLGAKAGEDGSASGTSSESRKKLKESASGSKKLKTCKR